MLIRLNLKVKGFNPHPTFLKETVERFASKEIGFFTLLRMTFQMLKHT